MENEKCINVFSVAPNKRKHATVFRCASLHYKPRVLRALRGVMKSVTLFTFLILLVGCTTTEVVGQYPINGIVSDKCNSEPISSVSIRLRFDAIDMGGDNTVFTQPIFTNENGEFRIEPQNIKLSGGVGGWSGSLHRWPTVLLQKSSYQDIGYGFLEASEVTYKSMLLTMEPSGGCP